MVSYMTMIRTTVSASSTRRAGLPICSALALVVAAGLAGQANAQQAPQAAGQAPAIAPGQLAPAPAAAQVAQDDSGVVNRILVRGNQRIDQTTVLSYLPIQPGDTVDGALLDVALRTLTRTQLFADVQLGLQPNGDLVITIVENPIINQVVFEGNRVLRLKKVTDEMKVDVGGI